MLWAEQHPTMGRAEEAMWDLAAAKGVLTWFTCISSARWRRRVNTHRKPCTSNGRALRGRLPGGQCKAHADHARNLAARAMQAAFAA